MSGRVITVVAGLIRDAEGRLLTVRKAGTQTFMLPGGKPEAGEAEEAALARELCEELGVRLVGARLLGRFEAPAANEPDAVVRSTAFHVEVEGEIAIQAEIEGMLWIDVARPPAVRLAPLLLTQVLPRLT